MGCDGWSHKLTLSPYQRAFAQHLKAGIHNQFGATIPNLAR
jgi:hypothetical protein